MHWSNLDNQAGDFPGHEPQGPVFGPDREDRGAGWSGPKIRGLLYSAVTAQVPEALMPSPPGLFSVVAKDAVMPLL
jgi:hypothetical protein